jgi:hypothetical protein
MTPNTRIIFQPDKCLLDQLLQGICPDFYTVSFASRGLHKKTHLCPEKYSSIVAFPVLWNKFPPAYDEKHDKGLLDQLLQGICPDFYTVSFASRGLHKKTHLCPEKYSSIVAFPMLWNKFPPAYDEKHDKCLRVQLLQGICPDFYTASFASRGLHKKTHLCPEKYRSDQRNHAENKDSFTAYFA